MITPFKRWTLTITLIVTLLLTVTSQTLMAQASQKIQRPERPTQVLNGGTFGVTPVASSKNPDRLYFNYIVQPGNSQEGAVLLSNATNYPLKLKLSSSVGTTSPSSGYAYRGAFSKKCLAQACWVAHLPTTVTVPAKHDGHNGHAVAPFHVTVPANAKLGEYLLGVTVDSDMMAHNTRGPVTQQVNVGVSLTVGNLAKLTKKLTITSVSTLVKGRVSDLVIHIHNGGQTFVPGAGTASCSIHGKKVIQKFGANVILPGDSATLQVAIKKLGKTSSNCSIDIAYGGKHDATWNGSVHPGVISLSTGLSHTRLYIIIGVVVVLLCGGLLSYRRFTTRNNS